MWYVLQVEQLKSIKYIPIYYRIYTHIDVYNHLLRIRSWYILMALPQEMIPYLFPDRWSWEGGLCEQENLFTVRDDSYYF